MKIGIGDPQARVRFGLRILLEQQPGWMVIWEAGDSQGLLTFLQETCPDLVLIDWELPDLPADELLRRLRAGCPSLLILSMSGKPELRQAALQAGADIFACKADPPEKLLGLIRELVAEKPDRIPPEISGPSSREL